MDQVVEDLRGSQEASARETKQQCWGDPAPLLASLEDPTHVGPMMGFCALVIPDCHWVVAVDGGWSCCVVILMSLTP